MIEEGDGRDVLPPALAARPLFLLKRVQAALAREIDGALNACNIDVREFTVLVLLTSEGPASQQSLSERLRIDRTTIVALVDELEGKQLARRDRDLGDRRAYLVSVTDDGRRVAKAATPRVTEAEDAFLGMLSNRDRQALESALRKIAEKI